MSGPVHSHQQDLLPDERTQPAAPAADVRNTNIAAESPWVALYWRSRALEELSPAARALEERALDRAAAQLRQTDGGAR